MWQDFTETAIYQRWGIAGYVSAILSKRQESSLHEPATHWETLKIAGVTTDWQLLIPGSPRRQEFVSLTIKCDPIQWQEWQKLVKVRPSVLPRMEKKGKENTGNHY